MATASAPQPAREPHRSAPVPRRNAPQPGTTQQDATQQDETAPGDHAWDEADETERVAAEHEQVALARRLVAVSNAAAGTLAAEAAFSAASLYDAPIFTTEAEFDTEQHLVALMIAAGQGLVDVFNALLDNDALWARLSRHDEPFEHLDFRTRGQLIELVTQELPVLLTSLGHRPPPQVAQWVEWVQEPLRALLSDPDLRSASTVATRARVELRNLTYRLSWLLIESKAALNEAAHPGSETPEVRENLLSMTRHRLGAALPLARRKAVTAALVAGAGAAAVATPAGPPGMAAAFATAAGVQAVKSAVEMGATALLAGGTQPTLGLAPHLLVLSDLGAVSQCVGLVDGPDAAAGAVVMRRATLQTVQDAADLEPPVREVLWEWARSVEWMLDAGAFSAQSSDRDLTELIDYIRSLYLAPTG